MAALEQIDACCQQFERVWRSGIGPDLRSFLVADDERIRQALLTELLLLDIDYRQRHEETADPSDYHPIFPGDESIIHDVFRVVRRESTAGGGHTRTINTITAAKHDLPSHPGYFGRYRILEQIGRGAFGAVYRVYDEQLQRDVAIKVPHRSRFPNDQAIHLFLNEARLLATLTHFGVVPVYDVGYTDDEPPVCYVVSKYMDGGDLAARTVREKPTSREAAELVRRLAQALHYAHGRGLIHRDVKLSNVLLDTEGNVCLADFGLAMRDDEFGMGHGLAGTPANMSPEQARGEGHLVDVRTDVYGLGTVLYELLTGKRLFDEKDVAHLLDLIQTHEPRSPLQIDPQIPTELDRICRKALSKRAADRYASASEMEQDIHCYLTARADFNAPAVSSPPRSVVPKGLRAFQEEDADFFLQLLPGPRDAEGLPDSVRFWKHRLEQGEKQPRLRVGVLYGPSGGGKSSFIRAALLPRLSSDIQVICVNASADRTELELGSALKNQFGNALAERNWKVDHTLRNDVQQEGGDTHHGGLVALLRSIRRLGGDPTHLSRPRILIVIDQFEQWLHAHTNVQSSELALALRQCDGEIIRAVVSVRDDFWLPITRFLKVLDVSLVEGENALALDCFDREHARRVLFSFGKAFGRLPADPEPLTATQECFLNEAVEALIDGDKIIPVRLSLLADMFKGKIWQSGALRRFGGITGLGVAFLDEQFTSPSAGPSRRIHAAGARRVLESLLPEPGIELRGQPRTYEELLRAAGYQGKPLDFPQLLQVLDAELRLIAPVDTPPSLEPETQRSPWQGTGIPSQAEREPARAYQLTHEYLVPSLREWLLRDKNMTWRGRAEVALSSLATRWERAEDPRFLPSLFQWMQIRLGVPSSRWTSPQCRLMQQGGWYHLKRWGIATALLITIVGGVSAYIGYIRSSARKTQVATRIESLVNAPPDAVPFAIEALAPLFRFARNQLTAIQNDIEASVPHRLHAALGLSRFGAANPAVIQDLIAVVPDAEGRNIASAARAAPLVYRTVLRREFDRSRDPQTRQRLAAILLQLGDPQPAQRVLRLRTDPTQRTLFIHRFDDWQVDLSKVESLLETSRDGDLCSGLAVSLGRIDPQVVPKDRRKGIERVLKELYRSAPSGAVHSAAGWALRRWVVPLPRLESSAGPTGGRQWFLDCTGQTMIALPGGAFQMRAEYGGLPKELIPQDYDDRPVSVELSPFLICDREVTVGHFRRFLEDPEYPDAEKPQEWNWGRVEKYVSPTEDCPVHSLSRDEAILYCNWLSDRCGRKRYYRLATRTAGDKDNQHNASGGHSRRPTGTADATRLQGMDWQTDPTADGYRLPTEAQWEYACRAMTTTAFCFGTDTNLLKDYACYGDVSGDHTFPCGSLQPNGWGLFDMHGNVAEWCQDAFTMRLPGGRDPCVDPRSATSGVDRGGQWSAVARFCRSGARSGLPATRRAFALGFRVTLPAKPTVKRHEE